MAIILSIETATEVCSVAVARDGRVVALRENGEGLNHSTLLGVFAEEALREAGVGAEELDADFLIILTAVEKAAVNFGKPEEKWLDDLDTDEARKYIKEGHFAPGSMLPKVQAAVKFAESKPGRTSLITLLEKAKDGIQGKTGTRIHL